VCLERTPDFLAPNRIGESLPNRFYVIVNGNRQDTAEDILASLETEPGVTLDVFGEPVLVKEFPESKIYEVIRVAPSDYSIKVD
jgi:hypothetical protein